MSVQVDNSYAVNSNTHVNKRQPRQEDALEFLSLIDQIGNTGKLPDSYGNIGRYKQYVDDLIEGLDQDGLEGFNKAKRLILNKEKYLASLYAIHQADQEQAAAEDQDTRTRTDRQGKRVFKTMSMDDVDNLPDLEYQVEKILQAATVSLLFGDSNGGKTFLALHLALCIAYGLPFFGRKVKQGPVLYIYAEGIRGLKPRSQAWRKHYNRPKTNNIQFIGFPVHLIEDRQTMLDTIGSIEEEQGIKFALIVVDTFSNCSVGISQNDQMEIHRVFASAHEIVRDYGCNVLVVHHTNNTGKFNGSAAFKNHVDTMIELKRADNNSPIIMHCEKQREDDRFKDISLDLQVVDLGLNLTTLEPLTSCVVVTSSEPTVADRAAETLELERQQILTIIKEHKRISVNNLIAECKAVGVSKAAYYQHVPYIKENKQVSYHEPVKNGQKCFYEWVSPVKQASLETDSE